MLARLRPFRFGLVLGILVALGFVASRYAKSRRTVEPPSPVAPVATPPRVEAPAREAAPAPAPAPSPAPATKKAPAKKAAAKKAPAKKAAAPARRAAGWVDPDGNICPQSHPIKAKLASKLFHLPGMFAYDRTKPDRCYGDEASAEADGLRKAKR